MKFRMLVVSVMCVSLIASPPYNGKSGVKELDKQIAELDKQIAEFEILLKRKPSVLPNPQVQQAQEQMAGVEKQLPDCTPPPSNVCHFDSAWKGELVDQPAVKVTYSGTWHYWFESKTRYGCDDKSRILLTAEDGTKHCVKF